MSLFNQDYPEFDQYMNITDPYAIKEYYLSPPFNTLQYSRLIQVYYIISGFFCTIGNLYIMVLFAIFRKLRDLQCNWLISFLCFSYVILGIGTILRGSTIMYAQDNLIFGFQFYLCTLITIPFAIPYRVGQFLTLIIALDRFIAVWKPFMYNKNQSFNNVIINGIASSGLSFLLVLILFMNMDVKSLVTLDNCTSPRSDLWYQVIPSYSGIVSILFFGLYLSSLLRLYIHLTLTKKQQVHAQDSITRIQKNIYITVSYALFCYSIFYGIPTILQMLSYYCKISGWVNDFSSYFIIYGGQFNGILNAVIYIFKHQEFKKCSKQLICKIRGKIKPTSDNYNNNTSKDVFKHVNNTEKF